MKAWQAHEYGPPESMQWGDVPAVALSEGEARVEIRAAGVNFPDALFIAGTYQVKPPLPCVPGFELAGVVVETRCASLPVGARVVGMPDIPGTYATHAVVSPESVFPIPDAMGFEDAAAITMTYQTGWFGLHRRARLAAGEWLLVHAGAGGVGSAAIQLGKAAGAHVIATAGSPEKVAVCKQLGADVAVDYTREDFVLAVKAATGGRGADVVYDPVGGEVFDKSTKCIAFEGRIVVVGFTSGVFPTVRANHVLVKNYAVLGLHWGMYRQNDLAAVRAAQEEIYRLYAAGKIKPLVSAVRPMSEAREALRSVASRASTGKVVLRAD